MFDRENQNFGAKTSGKKIPGLFQDSTDVFFGHQGSSARLDIAYSPSQKVGEGFEQPNLSHIPVEIPSKQLLGKIRLFFVYTGHTPVFATLLDVEES
jgi:hypothetical protein